MTDAPPQPVPAVKAKTVGLSNKLYASVAAIVVGIFVTLVVDQTTGLSILLTAVASLGLGAAAPADKQTTVVD